MGKFEGNLWQRIVERYGAELASTRPRAHKLRRRTPRLLSRTGLALAGVGFALALVLIPPAVAGKTPGGGGGGNSGTLVGNSGVGTPTAKSQCKNGGWRTFGVFKNQGDCVSFVATGGKNPPSGG